MAADGTPTASAAGPAPEQVRFRGVDDITLVGDCWPSEGPAVLMLHGGGQNRHSWKKTGQVLADRGFHVVAVDTRGHGDSDRAPDADYSIGSLTGDVFNILDAIGRPVTLIGASMGGLTGIMVAAEAGPTKVNKLVLVDVVPRVEESGTRRIREFMAGHVDGFASLEDAAAAISRYLPHRTKPRSHEGLKKNLRLRGDRWHWHWDPAFITVPKENPFGRVERMEQAAAGLQIPIMLIRGRLSDVVSAEGVREFLAKVPQTEFVELSAAGHTAAGDDNDAFSEVVVEFVSR